MKKIIFLLIVVMASCTEDDLGTLTKIEIINFKQQELYNEAQVSAADFSVLLKHTNEIYLKRDTGSLEQLPLGSYLLHHVLIDNETQYYFRMISLTEMVQPGNEIWVNK